MLEHQKELIPPAPKTNTAFPILPPIPDSLIDIGRVPQVIDNIAGVVNEMPQMTSVKEKELAFKASPNSMNSMVYLPKMRTCQDIPGGPTH